MDNLLARDEVRKPGVYILSGIDPDTGKARAYVGEAEVIRDRLKQHKAKDFWVQAILIVSKDENLSVARSKPGMPGAPSRFIRERQQLHVN